MKDQLQSHNLDYFIACVDEAFGQDAVKLTMKLRSAGKIANFSYKAAKLGKQLKLASSRGAEKCVIIGEEYRDNKLVVKDMETGQQQLVDADEFLSTLPSD